FFNRLLVVADGSEQILAGSTMAIRPSLCVTLKSLEVLRRTLRQLPSLSAAQFRAQLLGSLLRDLSLDDEHIGETAIVLLAPELFVLPHVHQLRADCQMLAALPDPSHDHGAHAQRPSGREPIGLFPFVAKGGAAGDHAQAG